MRLLSHALRGLYRPRFILECNDSQLSGIRARRQCFSGPLTIWSPEAAELHVCPLLSGAPLRPVPARLLWWQLLGSARDGLEAPESQCGAGPGPSARSERTWL